mmetsp:Transcript_39263/g.34939  ORF Transcript_39263/g.34939 Transcript_39263/m.34939 type:complete len:153 (+) Transcript_39263:1297-1755(+)
MQKKKKNEIEMFIIKNYDPFFKNINIDRVHNFELYFPNNNITRLMTEMERIRCEKILQRRLNLPNAKHIIPILVKGFRFHERKAATTSNTVSNIGGETRTSARPKTIVMNQNQFLNRPDPNQYKSQRRRSQPNDIVAYMGGTGQNHHSISRA